MKHEGFAYRQYHLFSIQTGTSLLRIANVTHNQSIKIDEMFIKFYPCRLYSSIGTLIAYVQGTLRHMTHRVSSL